MMFDSEHLDLIVCPLTGQGLQLRNFKEAEKELGGPLHPREDPDGQPVGVTPTLLVRADRACAYPVLDGVPILLAPEMVTIVERRRAFDLRLPQYAEAYEEMRFYNRVASHEAQKIEDSDLFLKAIKPILAASPTQIDSFPEPWDLWLDATYDTGSQMDAYSHIAPIKGKRVLQLGGMGLHAVKLLLAGASEAWVLTPMIGEVEHSVALAKAAGVADRLRCVVAVAEELPFASDTFDIIYSGGCVHHMVTDLALPEASRALKKGGKFAAVDPWRAPFYSIGTKVFGKREPEVYCRPLTTERAAPLATAFEFAQVSRHGALTRYPLIALDRVGVSSSLRFAHDVGKWDDKLSSWIPGLGKLASSAALLGTK